VTDGAHIDVGLGSREFLFSHFDSFNEQCPWIGLMFAVRHSVLGHGQPRVRNRRQFFAYWPLTKVLSNFDGA
jgi:hypothetical protein